MFSRTTYKKSPTPLVLNFLWRVLSPNFLFLQKTRYGSIFRENVKKAKFFCMKFPIRILLACQPKLLTKARNFLPKRRKLLFLLFEITFHNVFYQNHIFEENVQREKLFPIKFSIRALFTVYSRPYQKKTRNLSTKGARNLRTKGLKQDF